MASAAEYLVERFGSQRSLADALGTAQSTVAYWVKQGSVPSKWHPEIMQAAADNGIVIDAARLLPPAAPAPAQPSSLPRALYRGDLSLGDGSADMVGCYVLDDGRRLISRTGVVTALAPPSEGSRSGGDLETYIRPVGVGLVGRLQDELVTFVIEGERQAKGISAEFFLEVCKEYSRARNDGRLLTDRQVAIAVRASAFLAACATVGLIALIDEATGYQYDRAEDELRLKLAAFLEEEMRPWEKTFPDQLWVEFGRLTNWEGSLKARPKYWGKLVNELVYSYLDPDVYEWLKKNAPKPRHGQNYHQWLSSQYGLKRLMEHIWMLVGMAAACSTIMELRYRMAERFGRQPLQLVMFVEPKKRA